MIYVGSLKYSPVFKSHCCAFGRACEDEGYSVRYIFSRGYEWMLDDETREKTVFIGSSLDILSMLKDAVSVKTRSDINKAIHRDRPTHVYLHNYHFLNHYIAELSRTIGCTFVYHVHEPYVQHKELHGGIHQYWLYLLESCQEQLLKKTDIAIVSSSLASRLFDLRYPKFSGRRLLVPLMYEDLGTNSVDTSARERITFIGPPVPAKNPEKFMELARYSNEGNLGLKFLFVTNKEVGTQYYQCKNLEVFFERRMTDEEFGTQIKRSIAVVTPYKRETQSSVVLVSYMYGTPVVSSDVGGLSEFVHHKETGYLLDPHAGVEDWIEGINYVTSNFHLLSANCRKYFAENFSGMRWKEHLKNLLG